MKENFLSILDTILGHDKPFMLHEPKFDGNEWQYVKECIDTGWVSSVGQYVNQFEEQLAAYTGAKYVIAVVNGTAALQMSLMLSDVVPGDEVLVPALSFVATANAVSHCGAIPHFVDSNEDTLGLDPYFLEEYLNSIAEFRNGFLWNKNTNRRIKAVIPMHTFGHPIQLDKLIDVAKKFKLTMVEDAAESLGSFYQGQHTGTFGELGIISFNGNKIITTGGGGAILTNDIHLATRARHLTTTAKTPHAWAFNHDEVGFNFRMPNLNAALGCAQVELLPNFIASKRKLAKNYQKYFEDNLYFNFIAEPKDTKSNYWLNAIRIKNSNFSLRDDLLDASYEKGYFCRPVWTLLNKLPMYNKNPCSTLNIANKLEQSIICLPSSVKLGRTLC